MPWIERLAPIIKYRHWNGAAAGWVRVDELLELLNDHDCPLCSIPDELVQEWLSKARAVAKEKGYDV